MKRSEGGGEIPDKLFYFVTPSRKMGYTLRGTFSRDREKWFTFVESETHERPAFADREGNFIPVEEMEG